MAIFHDSRSDELKIRCDGCGKTEVIYEHETDHTLAHPWVREHGWRTMLYDKHWINICEKCKELIEDQQRREWIAKIKFEADQKYNDHSKTTLKPVSKIIEEVADEICSNYCKYPETWDEEKEGCELTESEICANCPLNRL